MKAEAAHRPFSQHVVVMPFRWAGMRLDRLSDLTFFMGCFLLQLVFTFQGIELSDEGFFATYYQRFFSDPGSVQYNFMFWLTGLIGSSFYTIMEPLGLWGMRLAGVLVNTATLFLVYRMLIRYIPRKNLMASLVIVLLALNNDAKEINYNSLSALFNVLIIFLLLQAKRDGKTYLLFIAGLIAAANIFIRLPNVLTAGFIIPVLLYGIICGQAFRFLVRDTFLYAAGMVTGILGFLALMKIMGHWEYFRNAAEIVFNMGAGKTTQKATENSYGFMTLLKQAFNQTVKSLLYAGYAFVLIAGFYLFGKLEQAGNRLVAYGATTAKYLVPLLLLGIYAAGLVHYQHYLFLLTGLALAGSSLILYTGKQEDYRLLILFGLFLLLYYPFGSSEGIVTAGRYSFWVAFPIGFNALLDFRAIRVNAHIEHTSQTDDLRFSLQPAWFHQAKVLFVALCLVAGFCHSYYYPFFDRSNRTEMQYGIANRNLNLIYTSPGRSEALNSLLAACTAKIPKGSEVIAYDCIPMIHFAAELKPYLHTSYPWLYHPDILEKDLAQCKQEKKTRPYIIRQKIMTIGAGSGWPGKLVEGAYKDWEVNRARNQIMNAFISETGYTRVWSDRYFEILEPNEK